MPVEHIKEKRKQALFTADSVEGITIVADVVLTSLLHGGFIESTCPVIGEQIVEND
jgi:hypothetical protein